MIILASSFTGSPRTIIKLRKGKKSLTFLVTDCMPWTPQNHSPSCSLFLRSFQPSGSFSSATFAVVCKNHGVVTHMLSAKRVHGDLHYSQLDARYRTYADHTLSQREDPLINVNELLPSKVTS